MKNAKCTVSTVLIVAFLISIFALCFTLFPRAQEQGKTINVYLIGGQSNAVGYATDTPHDAENDSRYYTGFENVLYFGRHEAFNYNEDNFVYTSIGLGRSVDPSGNYQTRSGSELGIAKALADTGEMNAVIKFAYGGTYLYPHTSASIQDNAKTWTSPSYINAHPDCDTGDNVGAHYTLFYDTVSEGIELLQKKGYTPVIRGMWWMQGENEGMTAEYATAYEELLTCLINDIRGDLTEICGEDYSTLPFIVGNVMRKPDDPTQYPALDTVNAAQAAVAKKLENVSVVLKSDYSAQSFFGHIDGWHFNADTYTYLGERFVEEVLKIENKYKVSAEGEGFTFSGGGTYSAGESVTVTFTPCEGYTISDIKMSVGGATATAVSLTDGSYTFGMTANDVSFTVSTSFMGTNKTTEYGTVPAQYNNPDKFPFVLFDGNNFVGAYEYYGKALAAVPTEGSDDEYTLLLLRDYATVASDSTTAPSAFGASVTLDLGGKLITRANRAYLFEIVSSSADASNKTITIKNGSLKTTGSFSLIKLDYSTAGTKDRAYSITFEGVAFINDVFGRGKAVIVDCPDTNSATAGAGISANLVFNGCTFDFGNTQAVMMSLSSGIKSSSAISARINGGSIISDTAGYTLYTCTAEDSVTVGEYSGKYPTVVLPLGTSDTYHAYIGADGQVLIPCDGQSSGDSTVYTLGEQNQTLATPYGNIDAAYADSGKYPIVIFKTDKTFVGGYSSFGEASAAAGLNGGTGSAVAGGDCIILIRSTLINVNGSGNVNGFTNNVTIDLGGNTVVLVSNNFLPLYIYRNETATATYGRITVKNGSFVTNSSASSLISPIRIDGGNYVNFDVVYNIDFDSVSFAVAKNSRSLNGAISTNGNNASASAKNILNTTMTSCTFNYEVGAKRAVMFNIDTTMRVVNANIIGGNISAGSNNAFDLINADEADNVVFVKDSSQNYTTLTLTSGTPTPTEIYKTGDEWMGYTKTATENGSDIYALTSLDIASLSITTSNEALSEYALSVFVDGEFVTLPYTADFAKGQKVTVIAKSASEKNYDVTINGDKVSRCEITVSGNTDIVIGISARNTVSEKTVVSATPGASATNNSTWGPQFLYDGIIVSKDGSALGYTTGWKANSEQTHTITFDLGSVQTINQISMFPRNDTSAKDTSLSCNYPVSFTVDVSSDNSSYTNVITVTDGDVPNFKKQQCYDFADTDAQYVKLTVTKLGPPAHDDGTTNDHYRLQLAEFDINYVSEPTDGVSTKYGIIPKENADASIVMFKTDKTFVGAYATFGDACLAAGLKGSPVISGTDFVILVRESFTNTAGVNNMQAFSNNVTIDLGGNTVTLTTQHLLPLYNGNPSSSIEYGRITIKNGTILNNSASNATISPIRLDSGSITNNLTYNVDAENVTFKVAGTSKSANGALSMSGNKGTGKLTVNATFTNCTFDFVGAPSSTTMITANATQRIANINIVGGKIIAGGNNAFKLQSIDSADTMKFKSTDGSDTTALYLAAGTAAPSQKIGSLEFVYSSTVGGYDIYDLFEKHTLGNIPANYTYADEYNFLLFTMGKSFVSGYATFGDACRAAGLKSAPVIKNTDFVILVRTSFTNTSGVDNMQAFYNNVTVDLGGNTVTLTTQHLLPLYISNPTSAVEYGRITIKNGTILNNSASNATISPIRLDSGTLTNNLTYNVSAENVTFKVAGTSKSANGALSMSGNKGSAKLTVNASFINCTFDFVGAPSATTMITANATQRIANISIAGGKIIAGGNNAFKLYAIDSQDSLTFSKDDANSYTALTMTSGTAAHTATYPTASGDASFVKTGTSGENDTYTLVLNAIQEFKPQSSITLDANLIFNVYIPENAHLTEITLDGKTYKIADLEALDGMYHFTVELPSAEAGREIPLTVTFGDEASASYTLSILKYASKLLADEGATATEKTLVCDMLAYVKSAYAYFGTAGAEEIASAIDALIGSGATKFEKIDDTNGSMAVGAGVNGVTFILDAEPKIRFYLAEGTDLTNYSFKIGGAAQEYTPTSEKVGETDFVCADISLFAYKMIGTVEVYNGSTKLGSFHINDYHDFALTQNNSALVDVVERFYMYCKSAKAYRDEVIAGQ